MATGEDDGLAARLAELERRVAALEGASEVPADAFRNSATEQFWALAGLRSRVPEPGAVLFAGSVTLPTGAHVEWQEGRPVPALLDADWAEATAPLAALGSRVRLRLLRAVLDGVESATALAALDGVGTSGQLYHHLRQLVAAGWLRSSARGRYEVPASRVIALLVVLAAART